MYVLVFFFIKAARPLISLEIQSYDLNLQSTKQLDYWEKQKKTFRILIHDDTQHKNQITEIYSRLLCSHKSCTYLYLGVSMVWVGSYCFIIFFWPDLIKFGSKNINAYPIRSGHGSIRPDLYKIIKYLLNIFI
jgi:hypothetical protein